MSRGLFVKHLITTKNRKFQFEICLGEISICLNDWRGSSVNVFSSLSDCKPIARVPNNRKIRVKRKRASLWCLSHEKYLCCPSTCTMLWLNVGRVWAWSCSSRVWSSFRNSIYLFFVPEAFGADVVLNYILFLLILPWMYALGCSTLLDSHDQGHKAADLKENEWFHYEIINISNRG